MSSRKLTLADIADVRAYERERDEFRQHVIDLKRRRRVQVGTIVTFVFENRDTVRFQVQEMARVEKLISDEQIRAELDIYNPMIPERGQLCATMFIELTSDEQVREWLPKLSGIERSAVLALATGDRVRALVDEQHDLGLTREAVTAAVHYLRWELTPAQVAAFEDGSVAIEIDLAAYREAAHLSESTHDELVIDLTR
jgi:hypothetical protein